jgi:hypothetical protein
VCKSKSFNVGVLWEEKRLKKEVRRSRVECEYLVGDDSCHAIKESDVGALRAEACHNEIKDTCCYLCSLREECEIRCDLLGHRGSRRKPKNVQTPTIVVDLDTKMECASCIYYLKRACPRGYSHDTELWRRQDPCEIFQPAPKASPP